MTALPSLSLRLLRCRVAAMVWTFMLLGAAWPDGLPDFSLDLLWAALALAGSYVAATSVNDIADADVDRINHPRRPGAAARDRGGPRARPLAAAPARVRDRGARSRRDRLARPSASSAARSLSGSPTRCRRSASPTAPGWRRCCSRSPTCPCRSRSARSPPAGSSAPRDARLAGALCRSLPGPDRAQGLPRPGGRRAATASRRSCSASARRDLRRQASPHSLPRTSCSSSRCDRPRRWRSRSKRCSSAIARHARPPPRRRRRAREEQVAIGLGARLGNGVLLCVLAWLVLGGEGATDTARATIVCGLAALFLAQHGGARRRGRSAW